MESLPWRVKRYILISILPALAIIALAARLDPYPSANIPWLAYVLAVTICWAAEEYRVPTRHNASHTLTAAVHLPLLLMFTPLEALALASISSMCGELRRRRSLYRVAYNAVVRIIAVGVPALGLAWWRLTDSRFFAERTFLNIGALQGTVHLQGTERVLHLDTIDYGALTIEMLLASTLAATLYFLLDSGLIATAVAIRVGMSPVHAWQANIRSTILPEITKSVLGVIAACVAVVNPLFVAFVALPVAVTHVTTRAILRLERETIDAVTALANSIDDRDTYTAQHSVRVAAMSRKLAQRLALSGDQVEEITLAAHVHDLGKMGIPDDILLKPGKLTAEEMAIMQTHPRKGVDVLQKYHNFRSSLPIVLHHHERFDGKGYPDGLPGNAIPLGAQVVAHADTYDAMTSDRPYRKGMRPEVAVQRIAEASGTQFDPAITGIFVAMMFEEMAAAGQSLPATGGSLAERASISPESLAAGAEDKVRYIYGRQ